MPALALIFACLSALLFILNFLQVQIGSYLTIYLILSTIAFIVLFYFIVFVNRKGEIEQYKEEIKRLRSDVERSSRRVADGLTEIRYSKEFPRENEEKKGK